MSLSTVFVRVHVGFKTFKVVVSYFFFYPCGASGSKTRDRVVKGVSAAGKISTANFTGTYLSYQRRSELAD